MKTEQNKQIDEIIARLESLKQTDKPKFEVGKWYRLKRDNTLGMYKAGGNDNFGFDNFGNWQADIRMINADQWVLADIETIKQALENEARRKGYTTSNFKCLYGIQVNTNTFEFHYNKDEDYLYIGQKHSGNRCYQQGQWAEVVEEKIMVGKWEVVFWPAYVTINENGYNLIQLQKLKECLELTGISTLIEGEELTLDTCQKIINKLSK